jgi:P2-related tail formation protein
MTEIGDALNAAMAPWQTPELTAYNNAIGKMFEQVELLSNWEIIFDVDNCPDYALPYLAQYVGARLTQGSSVAAQRNQIRRPTRQDRGTIYSIKQAIMPLLTGDQSVVIRERDGISSTENAWRLTIITLTDETPDPQAVLNAILIVKPAGIVLNYANMQGQDWESVDLRYATWAAMKAANATWADTKYAEPIPS